jgi:hypothetical protein
MKWYVLTIIVVVALAVGYYAGHVKLFGTTTPAATK